MKQDEANNLVDKALKEVDEICVQCINDIVAIIEEFADGCTLQLDEFYHSDFSSKLHIKLELREDRNNSIICQFLNSEHIFQISNKLISSTAGTNAVASGMKQYAGSRAHNWVLNIGHFFGHSFKPWEAVKWVKRVNRAGKALGVFYVVASWGMEAKKDFDSEKRKKDLRETRERLRALFDEKASEVRDYFANTLNEYLNQNQRSLIADFDKQVAEIRALRQNKSDTCKRLEAIQNECKQLIEDIHNDCN